MNTKVQAYLLDIEGTTTPVDFVHRTLFQYAGDKLASYLEARAVDAKLLCDLRELRREYESDIQHERVTAIWPDDDKPQSALAYLQWLIRADRKYSAWKAIQGRIWEAGYRAGELRGEVFADVPPALRRWHGSGKTIAIFSSGSTLAQELLFRYSAAGDLTRYIDYYFDTTIGMKREISAYRRIADALDLPPRRILFVSDIVDELKAASTVGMQTALSIRPGNAPVEDPEFPQLSSFEEVVDAYD